MQSTFDPCFATVAEVDGISAVGVKRFSLGTAAALAIAPTNRLLSNPLAHTHGGDIDIPPSPNTAMIVDRDELDIERLYPVWRALFGKSEADRLVPYASSHTDIKRGVRQLSRQSRNVPLAGKVRTTPFAWPGKKSC